MNWIVPTGQDVRKVIDGTCQFDVNEGIVDGAPAGPAEDNAGGRRDELVAMVVREVRGAIQQAGRFPLSLTPDSVPPDGEYHTLVILAWRLINSTPGLAKSFLAGDDGAETPLAKLYKEASAWLKGLAEGKSFVLPDNPTGADYTTAVSDVNPALNGVRWGDSDGSAADYEQGFHTDPDTGIEMPLPINMGI